MMRTWAWANRWAGLAAFGFPAVAGVLGLLVAVGRLYRGVHYPTDVLASVAFAVPWLLADRLSRAAEPRKVETTT